MEPVAAYATTCKYIVVLLKYPRCAGCVATVSPTTEWYWMMRLWVDEKSRAKPFDHCQECVGHVMTGSVFTAAKPTPSGQRYYKVLSCRYWSAVNYGS